MPVCLRLPIRSKAQPSNSDTELLIKANLGVPKRFCSSGAHSLVTIRRSFFLAGRRTHAASQTTPGWQIRITARAEAFLNELEASFSIDLLRVGRATPAEHADRHHP